MTIIGTIGMNRKKNAEEQNYKNEKEDDSLSIFWRNKFVLYSSRIKGIRKNEKEKLFLVNGKKKE